LRHGLLSLIVLLVMFISLLAKSATLFGRATPSSGEVIYRTQCASCHDQASPRIPPRSALQQMSTAKILRSLDTGLMMNIASPLRRDEREAVANFLGTPGGESPLPPGAFCSNKEPRLPSELSPSWNGWSPAPSNSRFQAMEQSGLSLSQVRSLKLRWAFGFQGDIIAFAAPTIVGETLFVGSASGTVYAMSAGIGCIYWTFQSAGPVRSAPLVTESGGTRHLVFGDQIGWFYALDAETGQLSWKRRIDEHEATRLTGSPVFYGGLVFVPAASWEETRALSPDYPCCTFRGSVTALKGTDGSIVWKTYLVEPPRKRGVNSSSTGIWGPSGAGVWSAPTVDARRAVLYVTTGDNYSLPATETSDAVVALRLETGDIAWSQQTTRGDASNAFCRNALLGCGPDYDYGSSAILVNVHGKEMVIAGQKSGMVYAFDPDQNGKILWRTRVGEGGLTGGIQWGMASDDKHVYAAIANAVRVREGSVSSDDFDPRKGGGLTALRLSDGTKAWFAHSYPCVPPRPGCSPAQSAALTVIPGAVFSGSNDGHLRAFSSDDGHLVWDFDTVREYETVNGVPAKGGSLDGAGPIVVGGRMYVNSGYPRFGGIPGNVLLMFSAGERSETR
jgi:polyvinyl alcohol dehydrogenase (cytochrome)